MTARRAEAAAGFEALAATEVDGRGLAGAPVVGAGEAVVDAAVTWLNVAVNRSGLALATEVRDYILGTFFGGDYAAFSNPSRTKPVSFLALCRRADLELSHATLYALVRVGEQVRSLPPAVAGALNVRQHRALLPLSDPAAKAALAAEAVAHGWSAVDIIDEVRALLPPEETRGRTPLPPAVKQARALKRILKAPVLPSPGERLTLKHRSELATALAALEAHAAALRAALAEPKGA